MKPLIAALCSFVIPGLGQLFYGKVVWAIFWFVAGCLTCGWANILAGCHVFFLAAD